MPRTTKYQWAQWGDLNAFFGLMLDNVTTLVLMTGLLVGVFGYPSEMVYKLMIPGTALGVLVGDVIYSWMAFKLAKKKRSSDVTAMPLGIDTPSTIGIALAVLGPAYVETKDPILTWQIGMATLMIIGVFKVAFSFCGDWVGKHVPQAGLLGSLAGVGIALLAFYPLTKIFSAPVVGLTALGIVIYAIIANHRLPWGIPGAFFAVAVGTLLYYGLGGIGFIGMTVVPPQLEIHAAAPLPTLGFIHGLGKAIKYIPLAFPFALLTIVGGINVTESARVAGDEYRTRDILLTEAVATVVAALFGGVAQSTPYIGHPAFKMMGGRAAYTLFTGLFIGIAGALGLLSFVIQAIPVASIAPILVFVAIEIVAQAFVATPKRHVPAVAFATFPIIGYLALIQLDGIAGSLGGMLPAQLQGEHEVLRALGHGFILTAMLWGGALADLIDGKLKNVFLYLLICTAFTAFGIIHSVAPTGDIYLPWIFKHNLVWQMTVGYGFATLLLAFAIVHQRMSVK